MADGEGLTSLHLALLGCFIEACSAVDVAAAIGLPVERVVALLEDLERAGLLSAIPAHA
ncbi:MAG TPA: hypothetical protein VNL98_10115 [Gemmatimonadales bacterium]|nr:hypothetical protein [Gemmatimonadales bacterium]